MSSQSWHADLADVRQPVDRPIENVGSIPVGGRIVPQRGEVPAECAIDPPLADSLSHAKMKHPERAERFGLPSEGQRHRVAGLNLLVTVVIFWNTFQPSEAVRRRKHASLTVGPESSLTSHPLGGPASCSPESTGGQSADGGLGLRFCPLTERPQGRCWRTALPAMRPNGNARRSNFGNHLRDLG